MSLGLRAEGATDDSGGRGGSGPSKRRRPNDGDNEDAEDDEDGEDGGYSEEEAGAREEEDASGALHMLANSGGKEARRGGSRRGSRGGMTPGSYSLAAAAAASPFGFASTGGMYNYADAAGMQSLLLQQHILNEMQQQQDMGDEDESGRHRQHLSQFNPLAAAASGGAGSPLALQNLLAMQQSTSLALAAAALGGGSAGMGMDGTGTLAALISQLQQGEGSQPVEGNEVGAPTMQAHQPSPLDRRGGPSRFKQEADQKGAKIQPSPGEEDKGGAAAPSGSLEKDAVAELNGVSNGAEAGSSEPNEARQSTPPDSSMKPQSTPAGRGLSTKSQLSSAAELAAGFTPMPGDSGGSGAMAQAALLSMLSPQVAQMMMMGAASGGGAGYGDINSMAQQMAAAAMSPLASNPLMLNLLLQQQQQQSGELMAALASGGGLDWASMFGSGGSGGFASPDMDINMSGRKGSGRRGSGIGSRGTRPPRDNNEGEEDDEDDEGGGGPEAPSSKRPWTSEESEYLSS